MQVILVAGVPAALGAVCGWVLGVNKTVYLVLSLLALAGGYVAGREHDRTREGTLRGVIAGAAFGGFILIVNSATGKPPKVKLPDPKILLLAITVVVSVIACAAGAADRKRLEEKDNPPQGFSLKRLHWSEPLGFVAAGILLGSLWLPWFATAPRSVNPNSRIGTANIGPGQTATAWHTFRIIDILLAASCVAPFILAYIVARNADLSWKPGEVTMIVGITAVILILCNGLILGKPKPAIDISFQYGYPIALVGAIGLFISGFLRQALHTDDKKPPGVL